MPELPRAGRRAAKLPDLTPEKLERSRWQFCAKQRQLREAPKIAGRKKLLQSLSVRSGKRGAFAAAPRSWSVPHLSAASETPWWQSRSNAGRGAMWAPKVRCAREHPTSNRIPWAAERSRACRACSLGWSTWKQKRGPDSEILRFSHEAALMSLDHLDEQSDDDMQGPPSLEETLSKVKEEETSLVPEACALALSTRNRLAGYEADSRPMSAASLRARVSSRHTSIEHPGSLPFEEPSSISLSKSMTSSSYVAPSKLSPRDVPISPPLSPVQGYRKSRQISGEVDQLQDAMEEEHAVGMDFRAVILAASVRKVQRVWRSKTKKSFGMLSEVDAEDLTKEVLQDATSATPKDQGEEKPVPPLLAPEEVGRGEEQPGPPAFAPEEVGRGLDDACPRASVSTVGGNDLRDTLPTDLFGENLEDFVEGRTVKVTLPNLADEDLKAGYPEQESSQVDDFERRVDFEHLDADHLSPAETVGVEDPSESQSVPSPRHLLQAVCTDKLEAPDRDLILEQEIVRAEVEPNISAEGASNADSIASEPVGIDDTPEDSNEPKPPSEDVKEELDDDQLPQVASRHSEAGGNISPDSRVSEPVDMDSSGRDPHLSSGCSEFEERHGHNQLTFSVAIVDVDKVDDNTIASHHSPPSPGGAFETHSRDEHLSVSEAMPSMTSASVSHSVSGDDPFLDNLNKDPFLEAADEKAQDVKEDLDDGQYSGEWSDGPEQVPEASRELEEDEFSGQWSSEGHEELE